MVVVDDQPMVELLGEALSDQYQVVVMRRECVSGRRIAASRPDLIVIDVDLHGDDALSHLRWRWSDGRLAQVPTIVMSADAYGLREHGATLAMLPALFVLAKPFSLDQLEALAATALRPSDDREARSLHAQAG